MPVPRIVRGQRVETVKIVLAKELRKEMTPEETILWERLRRSQLEGYHFRRQQVIHGFIADFYCHEAALIVELDGRVHEGQEDYDKDRDRILTSHGFRIARYENEMVRDRLEELLKQITKLCSELKSIRMRELP